MRNLELTDLLANKLRSEGYCTPKFATHEAMAVDIVKFIEAELRKPTSNE